MLLVGTDFSGLGSPEQALKRLNVDHKVVFACDKDKYVKQSYLANNETEIFYDDITTRDQSKTPYCDLYCFGFPCQAFSLAGNRKGFEDTRGTLFFNSLSYIKEKQPRVFIAENVKGLLSHDKVKGSKSKHGRTFGVIRDSLALTINGQHNLYAYDDCVNYHLYYMVLNSKNYGIPQNRERIFLIGFKNQVNFKFPKKQQLKLILADLLEHDVDEKYYLTDEMFDKFVFKSNSKNIGYINQDTQASQVFTTDGLSPTLCSGTHGYANGYIMISENTKKGYAYAYTHDSINLQNPNSKTRRGRVGKQIANTLDTQCNIGVLIQLSDNNCHSSERIYTKTGYYLYNKRIRRLTPNEVFRLFGYNDDFFIKCKEINSDTQLYKQGGNSIVVDTLVYLLSEVMKAIKIDFKLN